MDKSSTLHDDNSHNIRAKNLSEKVYGKLNEVVHYSHSPEHTVHQNLLTENDKLPWPIPYENAEKEFKWKTIKSEIKHYQRTPNQLHPTVKLNGKYFDSVGETTSTTSLISTNNPQSIFTSPLPPYHPYEFENVHLWSNNPAAVDEHTLHNLTLPHEDIFVQSIERLNESTPEYTRFQENSVPVERINKEYEQLLYFISFILWGLSTQYE